MVSFYRIDNDPGLLVLSAQVSTNLDMGALDIVVDGLTDIMQQSGSLCHTDIQSDLTGK